eukprot:scaffold5993_cov46-Phaeocystis_antarctica.AAC.1
MPSESPAWSSSSPELERPHARLTLMASGSCASRERAPRDMPPVTRRSTVASIGSTSASVSAIGPRADAISSMLRATVTAVTATCSSFKLSFRSSTSLIGVGVSWLELQSPGSLYTSSVSYFPATPMLGRPSPSVSSQSRIGLGSVTLGLGL